MSQGPVPIIQDPVPIIQDNPRSRSSFRRQLGLRRAHIFSIVRTWLSRTPSPTILETHKELGPLQDTQTPHTPPAIPSIWDPDSGLSEKVRRACEIARRNGYLYIWVDSSCIDKTSSSELSEAINSMYSWYRAAHVCYAFLADVSTNGRRWGGRQSEFSQSRWFRRCWTLQELIAPLKVIFFSQTWDEIGTKDELAYIIYNITSIDCDILTHERELSGESVTTRIGWAANREATRVEDEAYSLLGILGITMPTLYGEGRHAFRRLQEELLQRIRDQSIFAWGTDYRPFPLEPCEINPSMTDSLTLLAPSLRSFELSRKRYGTIRATGNTIRSLELPVEEYIHTPYGIRTRLRLLPLQALNPELKLDLRNDAGDPGTWYLALLACQPKYDPKLLLSRLCCLRNDRPNVEFLLVPDEMTILLVQQRAHEHRTEGSFVFTISLDDLERMSKQLETKTVYLPHPKPSVTERLFLAGQGRHNGALKLTLPTRVQDGLWINQCAASNVQGPTEDDPNSFSFSLRIHWSFNVNIHYRHMIYPETSSSEGIMIQARVWILSSDAGALLTDAAILCSPPYVSTTWADRAPWYLTLPARRLVLIADSGEQVTLKLWLDLMAPLSRYNVHVDVVPTSSGTSGPTDVGAASLHADSEDQSMVRRVWIEHETFNLILTGSVRMALEMKGYSPHLALDQRLGGLRTHSLTLSRDIDSFAIVVKFFCTLVNTPSPDCEQKLVVVARITLESLIPDDEVVRDGPHVALWRGGRFKQWQWSLEDRHVVLAPPNGELLTLHLGFDLAWQSEYHLRVDIEPVASRSQFPELSYRPPAESTSRHNHHDDDTLALVHGTIDMTLPGHVARALQDQGYQVRFERLDGGGESNDPVRYFLTLSHIPAGVTIVIEYFYGLPELVRKFPCLDFLDDNDPFLLADPHPDSGLSVPVDKVRWTRNQQELIFRASVRVLPYGSATRSPAPVQDLAMTATVDWDAGYYKCDWREGGDGWRRHLPNKDIILTLPTGNQLVLRLGFYYVWNGEYCLMVQINPRKPLSRTPSRDEGPPMPEYELDEAGMEYIRQSLAGRTEPEWSEAAHDEPLPTDPSTEVVAPEGSKSPVCGQDGDSDGGASGGGNDGADDE